MASLPNIGREDATTTAPTPANSVLRRQQRRWQTYLRMRARPRVSMCQAPVEMYIARKTGTLTYSTADRGYSHRQTPIIRVSHAIIKERQKGGG